MKTITITIDDVTFQRMKRLLNSGKNRWGSRSAVVRQALQEFLTHLERLREEEREREIFRRNRARLGRQSAALIQEQARP